MTFDEALDYLQYIHDAYMNEFCVSLDDIREEKRKFMLALVALRLPVGAEREGLENRLS